MLTKFLIRTLLFLVCGAILAPAGWAQDDETQEHKRAAALRESMAVHERVVAPFLARYCQACHGAELQEAELSFATLEANMEGSSAARWALVVEQLVRGEMPPDGEPKPEADEVAAVVEWIKAELKRSGKHLARRPEYHNGNTVPHALLFDPRQDSPLDAPARIRRLSPEIYATFSADVGKNARGLGQPFTSPAGMTFTDMGTPLVDEPTTAQLIDNALAIVQAQTSTREDRGQTKWTGLREFEALFQPDKPPTDEQLRAAIAYQFRRILHRPPTDDEFIRFLALYERNVDESNPALAARYMLAAVLLLPDAVLRWELGDGQLDAEGRLRLSPREIAFAVAYALTDQGPEAWLIAMAESGDLDADAGVESAVRRMLADDKLAKPRILRFFHEYFEYPAAADVFKLREDFPEHKVQTLISDTDSLVRWILERDEQVLSELLSTNRSFVNYRYDPNKKVASRADQSHVHLSYNLPPDWKWTPEQPIELPRQQRAGILTQPAWLVAFSKSDENNAIIRGKWIRERLLGGVVPDIPITVDAQLPNEPTQTLRERMRVTQEAYCWQCHTLMNRVGLPLEMYDHFGRFRTMELGRPVDASGGFEHVAASELTGDTENAIDFVRRMAESPYVEQVFVRHAFRYWMGRNETLGDAETLQAAHDAYRKNNGSMQALIVSLLTSESFLYRAPSQGTPGSSAAPAPLERRNTITQPKPQVSEN
jgi:mono/diheme cytochrome c family protein